MVTRTVPEIIDVRLAARIAHLVDALAGVEVGVFHLAGEYGGLFIVQQRKEGNLSQNVRIASHSATLSRTRYQVFSPCKTSGTTRNSTAIYMPALRSRTSRRSNRRRSA